MPAVSPSHRPPSAAVTDDAGAPLRRWRFAALGTTCEVHYACGEAPRAAAFEHAATGWVQAFEAKYSRFRPDSLVSRINAAAGCAWVEIDEEMEQMLKLCEALYVMTHGVLDPTALPLLRLWNYKAAHPVLPTEVEVAAALRLVGWRHVQRAPGKVFLPVPGMALDFGGFGKEYAVDVVAQIAATHGIRAALVDFGHDLRTLGTPPGRPAWHIGLEDPRHPGDVADRVALPGWRGIASSGDYLRSFTIGGKRYGHIVDPRTGRPVANGCLQATVIAATCLQAGILSTTAFVLGMAQGVAFIQAFPGAEGLLVADDARAQTRGFFNYVVSN